MPLVEKNGSMACAKVDSSIPTPLSATEMQAAIAAINGLIATTRVGL